MFTREGNIYLPSKQDSTQQFLRSIMLGVKQYVKWEDVSVIKVPQYKELHIKDLLRFATTKINIKRYLPDYEYSKDPNRECLCNVLNTLIPKDFQSFIDEKVQVIKQESRNTGQAWIPKHLQETIGSIINERKVALFDQKSENYKI